MTARFTKIFQVIAVVAQIATQVQTFLPPKAQAAVGAIIAAAQGIQGLMAHYRAPDGSKLPPEGK